MQTRAVAVAATLVAALAAIGCGSSSDDGSAGSTAAAQGVGGSAVANATPRGTKPLEKATWWVSYRPPYTLDPIRYDDYPEDQIIDNLCEPLLRLNADFELEPHIAESWTDEGGRVWTYKIRDDVTFWDGSRVTARDVAYSLNRNMDPELGSFYRTPFENVRSITARGDEVTVSLRKPDYTFHERMGAGGAAVVQERFVEQQGDRFGTPSGGLMCSGPFKLKDWKGSTSVVVEANETYWNEELKPNVGEIEFVFPQDPGTVARGFVSGAFDGGFRLPPGAITQLRNAASGELIIGTSEQTLMTENLAVVNFDGPLRDKRVRQALSKAIDRDGLSRVVGKGASEPLYAVATPGFWGYAKETFRDAYDQLDRQRDVEGAKALMAEAGGQQQPIRLATSTSAAAAEHAAIIQQSAKDAGIDVEIKRLPPEQYGEIFGDPKSHQVDMIVVTSYDHAADPLLIYGTMAQPGGVTNFGGYDNPQVTRLLEQARATEDLEERAKLVVEVQSIVMDELPWIPLQTPLPTLFQNRRITGAPVAFTWMNSPWAAGLGGT